MRRAWIVVLLAGCAAPHWEKAGSSPDEAGADLKQCEAAAPLAPQKRAAKGPSTKPGSNTIDFDSAAERSFDRARKDDEAVAACMRAKGYVR